MAPSVPLLLSDGTPMWLHGILLDLAGPESPEKALISALVVVMVEMGFHLENGRTSCTGSFDATLLKELPSMISFEKTQGRYKMGFGLSNSPKKVHFVAIPVGTILIVNLMVLDDSLKVETLPLTIDEFIDSGSQVSLKNHQKLSDTFRTLLLTVKSRMLPDEVNCHHIFHLPVEILSALCKYLSPQEFVKFGKTCRRASALLEIDSVWKTIARRFFPSRKLTASESWKDFTVYQITQQKQQEHRAARQKINEEYRKYKEVQKEEAIRERIEFSKTVEDELKTTVVQAREKEPGKYVLRITAETTKLDNFPFDPNVEIPRAKRRELAKACCQVKIDK